MRKLALSVALASISSAAMALGFGEIRLHSGLNQRLNADIPLLSVAGIETDTIKVKLASSADFARVGAERLLMLDGLQFKLVERNGRTLVEVTSKTTLKEPFLDFVVEMSWPQGRVLRQFTLLLDPPVFSADANGVITQAIKQDNSFATTAKVNASAASPAKAKVRAKAVSQVRQSLSAKELEAIKGDAYRTKASDSLWKIANRSKPSNLSVQQMMEAIYQANPDAFVNQDMGQLKSGQDLKIPDAAEAMRLTGVEAKALVAADKAPAKAAEAVKSSSKLRSDLVDANGKPVASLENPQSSVEGRLQLASVTGADKTGASDAAASEGGANSEVNRMKSELVRSQEAMETVNRQNAELNARIEEMTSKMQEMEKKLITVNNPNLASITQSPASATTPAQPEKTLSPEAIAAEKSQQPSTTTEPKVEPTSSTAVATTPATAAVTEAPLEENKELKSVVEQPVQVKTVQREQPISVLPTDESMQDTVIKYVTEPAHYPYLGIGAGLLGLLSYFLLRRRKMQQQASEPVFAHNYANNTNDKAQINEPQIELRETKSEPSVTASPAKTSTVDLGDVMSEVDIYVAYGRFSQAEILLRDALTHSPDRLEIKLKLLECLGQMGRAEDFDLLAQQLRDTHPYDQQVLGQIKELHAAAWPGETMVEAKAPDTAKMPEVVSTEPEPSSGVDLAKLSFDEVEQPQAELPPLAFDLDAEPKSANAGKKTRSKKAKVAEPAAASSLSLAELDFNETSNEDPLNDGLAMPLSDATLDSLASDEDGAMTKLHLAEAYLDMGDMVGAREILNEVLSEGNSQQRKEAHAMLERIV